MIENNETKLSCYIDRSTYDELKAKALSKGLSLSAYLRFLIKKDLQNK